MAEALGRVGRAYSWKPALVGSRCEVRVDAAGAEVARGSRTQRVNFSDVTGGRLLELNMRTSSVSLILMHAGGKFVIHYGGAVTDAAHSKEAAGFLGASVAVLEGLAKVKPAMQLQLGGGPGLRWTLAVMGVVMAVIGALLALVPFGEGQFDLEGAALVLVSILIVAGGVGMAGRFNPFAKLQGMTPDEIAAILRSHLPKGD